MEREVEMRAQVFPKNKIIRIEYKTEEEKRKILEVLSKIMKIKIFGYGG